jgi:hypothetical protein
MTALYRTGLVLSGIALLLASTAQAQPETKQERIVVFSKTSTVAPGGYLAVAAESQHFSLAGAQQLTIQSGHCALSSHTGNDAKYLQATASTLGIGLYDVYDNYIAELYTGYQVNSGGSVRSPLTYWSGIVAIQQHPPTIDLADMASSPVPGRWTVGLDADVWNTDARASHQVDTYCVLVVDIYYWALTTTRRGLGLCTCDFDVEKGWGGPFGCVIVKDVEIIGRGQNRVLLTGCPVYHAEITAIIEASARLNPKGLLGSDYYAGTMLEMTPRPRPSGVPADPGTVFSDLSL